MTKSISIPKAKPMSVRIVDIQEVTKPIASPIRNAYIDFTKMTTSLVAVVTDAVRGGGWSASHCIPHGGHQMSLNIAAGLGLGGNENYPGSSPMADSLTAFASRTVTSPCRICRASALKGSPISTRR